VKLGGKQRLITLRQPPVGKLAHAGTAERGRHLGWKRHRAASPHSACRLIVLAGDFDTERYEESGSSTTIIVFLRCPSTVSRTRSDLNGLLLPLPGVLAMGQDFHCDLLVPHVDQLRRHQLRSGIVAAPAVITLQKPRVAFCRVEDSHETTCSVGTDRLVRSTPAPDAEADALVRGARLRHHGRHRYVGSRAPAWNKCGTMPVVRGSRVAAGCRSGLHLGGAASR